VDKQRRTVTVENREIAYDHLVLATGARHSYFGHDEWAGAAPGLKKIDDATDIRRRILTAFEKAEAADGAEARRRFLTFVVIGGGATGVEMAGAIAELAHAALRHDFRRIDPREARIVLVEAGPRLLPAFAPVLSNAARCALEKLGVEVRLGERVSQCDAQGVVMDNRRLEAATIVWGAGVMASAAGQWLGADQDRLGRAIVEPDLSLRGHPEIFLVGDTAHACDAAGQPLPGLAPVAKQQGACRPPAARQVGRQAGAEALPLPELGHHGDHRTALRRGGSRLGEARRDARLAALGPRPRFLPDRIQEPHGRDARLAVVVCHLPVWRPAYYRNRHALASLNPT
jgi:NADH dehydrogenase